MTWEVRQGDALDRLREMPDGSVQTCVTSPPYFGLRDYGTGEWEGGGDGCDHTDPRATKVFGNPAFNEGRPSREQTKTAGYRESCGKCGARRVDQQVGLEPSPDEYVARLVEVFREVRRVLRDDGTLWLNLGDSYNADGRKGRAHMGEGKNNGYSAWVNKTMAGTKQKDLLGVPWMVAFALRADGWWLRSDIVWSKPNPMPESVTDRPTKAHEYLFLLSKQRTYFYDADAVREDGSGRNWATAGGNIMGSGVHKHIDGYVDRGAGRDREDAFGRNKRSVWTVATQPFPGAHFAVFPPKLIEPCVLAGSSPKACGVCGGPWVRLVEKTPAIVRPSARRQLMQEEQGDRARTNLAGTMEQAPESRTVGWEPSCTHTDDTGSCVILDPFNGAGTTGLVAVQHGRSYIGIELNPEYAEMARERIATAERLGFRSPERGPEQLAGQGSFFDEDAA